MSLLDSLSNLFQDAPPEFVCEVTPERIVMARAAGSAEPVVEELAPSVLSPSPVRDNVLDPDAFAAAVKRLATASGPGRKLRRAALILPDHSARVSVLDFDHFPEKHEERLPLLHFRLKKTLPYDIDSAALSYFTQPLTRQGKREVVAVVTPLEVVARYEAPFRAANFQPGIVTVSHLAMLDLVPAAGVVVVAKLSGDILTVMALDHGILRLVRSIELTELTLDEIAADLYPTFAYAEDNFGAHPDTLILAGFDDLAASARQRFEDELTVKVDRLPFRYAGLAGYLQSRKIPLLAAGVSEKGIAA